ncbi:MAG: RelA/SpoT family protein [Alphaproteobacteria bacterium]
MMLDKKNFLEKISSYDSNINISLVEKACDIAIDAHGKQLRESGEPYYHHPFEVALIIARMKLDTSTIITALLHDTVEDTHLTLKDIEEVFGNEVSKLVDGVTKLTKIESQSEQLRQAENFRKLLLAISEDIRVLLVKLADRVHNMRTLKYVKSPEKRLRKAHETMEIYAPLAERIGIQTFKNELQDLAFSELHFEARSSIIHRLDFLRKEGAVVVDKIVANICKLIEEADIKANVIGREKTPCSIWQKMEKKNIGFEQLSDIMAFRILVNDVTECYKVLGVIHSNYHMVPENFKDFISTPKSNGYQSIHTVVIGPEQQRIEIQIRTYSMHEVAEYGVAAHWTYKQNRSYDIVEGKQYRWVRELLDILDQAVDAEEFLENTKMEMYYDQVFCFTPKGNLIALPKGATPVDFAYAVHSKIGHTCVGAKVNGRIVPLRFHLKNGDQVEIIRSRTQVPSPAWEKFVVTGKARSEVKRFIRAKQKEEYTHLGKAIVSKVLKQENIDINEKIIEKALTIFKKKNIDDFYASIGEGTIAKSELLKLLPNTKFSKALKDKFSFLNFRRKKAALKDNPLSIKGLIPGMALHYAGCCHPLPGDSIVGIVHTGKGITIHTADCEILENFINTPERWVSVSWDKEGSSNIHIGRVKIILAHEAGSLATISNTIAKYHTNIINLKITNRTTDYFEMLIDLEVQGSQHLTNILTGLRSKDCVHSAERYKL